MRAVAKAIVSATNYLLTGGQCIIVIKDIDLTSVYYFADEVIARINNSLFQISKTLQGNNAIFF